MSGAKVPYHLRQNKHIEREIFVQLLTHVGRIADLTDYLYVGFGGAFFEDFKALHSRLAIRHMLSIEKDEWVFKRQRNNIPYGCVRCEMMESRDFVNSVDNIRAKFKSAGGLVCWLDYASPKQLAQQLDDIQALIPKLRRKDIIKITLNANVAALDDSSRILQPEDRHRQRMDRFRQRLGAKFPGNIDDSELDATGYPGVLLKTLQLQIGESMKENPGFSFQPMGCYVYADSNHPMMTCTGIVLNEAERKRFGVRTGLGKFDFSSLDWRIHHIDVPYLSAREKLLLDQKMFNTATTDLVRVNDMRFDEDDERSVQMIDSYSRLYRFYPHFHRIQY